MRHAKLLSITAASGLATVIQDPTSPSRSKFRTPRLASVCRGRVDHQRYEHDRYMQERRDDYRDDRRVAAAPVYYQPQSGHHDRHQALKIVRARRGCAWPLAWLQAREGRTNTLMAVRWSMAA